MPLAIRALPPGVARALRHHACLPGSVRSPAPDGRTASPGPVSSARGPGRSCLRMSCNPGPHCTQRSIPGIWDPAPTQCLTTSCECPLLAYCCKTGRRFAWQLMSEESLRRSGWILVSWISKLAVTT
ncbi:rCG38810, isoform CRA_b [Rattus norvegicus]|uniref:RCG38810, isoform CRA_b n=1 Tax=Rattus norvegicus TaxID=10116 RepID=A6K9S7_RAT|nr:rCG38810, isoform CRA_b [Rattus norvegicus]